MTLQFVIVMVLIAAAIAYAGVTLFNKRRSFSSKQGCADDCGCSGASKKLPS